MKFARTLMSILLMLVAALPIMSGVAVAQLRDMGDKDLEVVSARGLLESDKIVASSITGTPAVDSGLTFYRMGINADLAFNANINRLQLGCGGANNRLVVGCDIDLSNVGFMGLNTSNNTPCPIGASAGACPNGTDFIMRRPYIELAIANDNTPQRQVVGFSLGSQSATGFLSVGQVYTTNSVNQETGATCYYAAQCNSGINMFSGYIAPTFTGAVGGTLTTLGFIPIGGYTACFSLAASPYCPASTPVNGTAATPITCTRCASVLTSAQAAGAAVALGIPVNIGVTAYVYEALSIIHGLSFAGVPNFDISVQRQQVAYPNYNKTGWDVTANTGWWMGVPGNVFINIPNVTGPNLDALGTLLSGAATLANQNLGQTPASNCYGSYKFC